MLKHEEIEKRIEAKKQLKHWVEVRAEGLRGLGKEARAIGFLLLGCSESEGKHSGPAEAWKRRARGTERFRKLDDATMLRLGAALFPQFPQVFAAAWKLHELLPYQVGYARRPFRAPGRPELLHARRAEFLSSLMHNLEGLDVDLAWLAAYAPHVSRYSGAEHVGLLLAAALDAGGKSAEDIAETLRASAEGTHEVGEFGRHVTTALLCSARPERWEYVQKLLLAAQRQEGLRQVILESLDFAHPDAFRRMLRVILDNHLVRFSAAVRALDVWLGLQLDSQSSKYVESTIEALVTLLDDPQARAKALAGSDAERSFLALWAAAFDDGPGTVQPAAGLLKHRQVEMRFMGVHLLAMLDLPEAYAPLVTAVDDADDRVAVYAVEAARQDLNRRMHERDANHAADGEDDPVIPAWMYAGRPSFGTPVAESGDLFERLEKLFARLPAKAKPAKPLVWPWVKIAPNRQTAADCLVPALGQRPPAKVLPYLDAMSPQLRQMTAELMAGQKQVDAPCRAALVRLVGDAAGPVRESAVQAMTKLKLAARELPELEPLLTRKSSDLRRGVLGLILSLKDAEVLGSAGRLLESKAAAQRLAGLDLLLQMRDAGRAVEKVRAAAEAYRGGRPKLERAEQEYLDKLLAGEHEQLTLADALGLMDPSKRTPPATPQKRAVKLSSPAAVALIRWLDSVVDRHREDPVTLEGWQGDREPQPLGSIEYGFPGPFEWDYVTGQIEKQSVEKLPLREIWSEAWDKRPASARDADGLEAARAVVMCSRLESYHGSRDKGWRGAMIKQLLGDIPRVQHPAVVGKVLEWWVAFHTEVDIAEFLLDGYETLLAAIPPERLGEKAEWRGLAFRELISSFNDPMKELRAAAEARQQWTAEHTGRLFRLNRWVDEPLVPAFNSINETEDKSNSLTALLERDRVDWKDVLAAYAAGQANEHDVFDALLGPRNDHGRGVQAGFDELSNASRALRKRQLSPAVAAIVERAIARVLEIEMSRGEAETPATPAAMALSYAGGADVLIGCLQAMGGDAKLKRNATYYWSAGSQGKASVLSHVARVTVPGEQDTPARFVAALKKADIGEDLLLAVALYAPQWVRHIETAVGWEALAEAVWWFHAHTKDNQWRVEADIRESWNAEIRKLTPLTLEDLVEGAVDVDWFNRVHAALGAKRWARLDEFAKYASGGAGHKRAQLFAAAMLNQVKPAALIKDIKDKRKQDAVRALGLVPLDKKATKKDVLDRYKLMQEFVRTSRQFGSQRQASEKLAARIGQENLARTAGYPDPIRLQWAMEGLATADLAKGPVVVKVKDVAVQLAIGDDGLPEVSVARGAKTLKSIPPEVKKHAAVQELGERKTELRRSASRMRQALELAMCRGDRFSGDELKELLGNVILRPMLERVVFVGDGVLGYPVDGGKGLRDCRGKIEPVKRGEVLRLAHPTDLLASKQWSQWQRDCFTAERVQPFKQVFRELYVLTEQERRDATFSRRYAGQQVNPRQALALLGARGWVTAPEAGVFRSYHDEKLVAWIEFMEPFYTPAEVEGLTLEKVRFARRGADEVMKLADVPRRLLSETLRDVDLIVSVAHRGGVDPEASASTVEMRAALLRETIQLLKLGNVKIQPPHVYIHGTRAEYSVHLGSATTHMLPGGALFIVPVHSQHRGRLFLPFADDDPKSAEVLSKVLLLSRDQEIQDPNLLDQIRSRG